MRNKVILTAAVIGAISELAVVIYMTHIRGEAVFGGEYLVLPLCLIGACIVLEILDSVKEKRKVSARLTRRRKDGRAVLDENAFPTYASEVLNTEVTCFEPIGKAVEKLCRYEEYECGGGRYGV